MYGSRGRDALEGRQLVRGSERGSRGLVGARAQSTARRTLDRVAHCTLGQAAQPDSGTPRLELRKERGLLLVLTA